MKPAADLPLVIAYPTAIDKYYIYYIDIISAHFEPAWLFWNVNNNPSYFGNLLINQVKNKIWKEQEGLQISKYIQSVS